MTKTIVAALVLLAACARPAPAPPRDRVAFCGSPCWNNAACYQSGGEACGQCVSGACAGSVRLADDPETLVSTRTP